MNWHNFFPFIAGKSGYGRELRSGANSESECPQEDEVLAYWEGRVSSNRRDGLHSHFVDCDDCREFLALFVRLAKEPAAAIDSVAALPYDADVNRQSARVFTMIREDDLNFRQDEPLRDSLPKRSGFSISIPQLGFAAAAVTVILVTYFVFIKKEPSDSGMQALIAAVRTERLTPVRISGGFEYSPYPETRGGRESDRSLQFEQAFGKLKSAEASSASTNERVVLARAYLARNSSGDAQKAQSILDQIAATGKQSAEIDNDRGVALFELEDYEAAVASFTRALEQKQGFSEALFNKALTEERLKLNSEAKRDWGMFISLSRDAKWNAEAQQHLDLLNSAP